MIHWKPKGVKAEVDLGGPSPLSKIVGGIKSMGKSIFQKEIGKYSQRLKAIEKHDKEVADYIKSELSGFVIFNDKGNLISSGYEDKSQTDALRILKDLVPTWTGLNKKYEDGTSRYSNIKEALEVDSQYISYAYEDLYSLIYEGGGDTNSTKYSGIQTTKNSKGWYRGVRSGKFNNALRNVVGSYGARRFDKSLSNMGVLQTQDDKKSRKMVQDKVKAAEVILKADADIDRVRNDSKLSEEQKRDMIDIIKGKAEREFNSLI